LPATDHHRGTEITEEHKKLAIAKLFAERGAKVAVHGAEIEKLSLMFAPRSSASWDRSIFLLPMRAAASRHPVRSKRPAKRAG